MTAMTASLTAPGHSAPGNTHYIDLGSEPPLSVGTPSVGAPARRAVSIRWLAGTILTGLTSFVLIGGALFAALNGQQLVAAPPQSADYSAISARLADGQKGNRIMPVAAPPATREIIPVATVLRQDDRELIQQRDYVLISAALATAVADGAEIPAYDPITIVGEAANNEPVAAAVNQNGGFARGDVEGGNAAVRTLAFPLDEPARQSPDIPPQSVEQIVSRNAAIFGDGDFQPGVLAYANAAGFGFGDVTASDPFSEIGVRMIPENVSFIGKDSGAETSRDERMIAIEPGTPLGEILTDSGMTAAGIVEAMTVLDGLIDLAGLTAEHRLRVAFEATPPGSEAPQAVRVSIYENEVHQATVARDDDNQFVRADEPSPFAQPDAPATRVVTGAAPRLYEALYRTALEQGVATDQINDLVRIFAFELDMQSRVGPTDSLQLFHAAPDDDNSADDPILFASITMAGVNNAFYRFQTEDGEIEYYDAAGHSADNFLLRKPISGGELRSTYGNRLHPVLRVYRLHSGVDWAAPRGTPIVAAGDGTVVTARYNSGGYGNYTIIEHRNGYATVYAHQTGFAAGIEEGVFVRQGQVIGYVGSTGLSTGNHLHYEVKINGQTVNPLTIRLPEGRVLAGAELAAFQAQRNQINNFLGIAEDGTQIAGN